MTEFRGEQPNIEAENTPIKPKSDAEFRTEQGGKVLKILKHIHAYDYVRSISAEHEDRPSFEEFRDFLIRLNGIARDIPIAERKPDGENVQLSGFIENTIVPKHSDKEELLKYTYEAISDIPKEDVKYLLPAMVNAVHLFGDGNGRTSRILHQLLTEHASEQAFLDETEKALGKYGRYDSLDINPGLISWEIQQEILKNHGWVFTDSTLEKLGKNEFGFAGAEVYEVSDEIYKQAKEFFRLYESDQIYTLTTIYMLYGDEGIKKLFTDKYKANNPDDMISPHKMVEILTAEEWQQLIDNFYQLKKEEVMGLVDIFKNPKNHKTTQGNEEITLKEYFIRQIYEKHEST